MDLEQPTTSGAPSPSVSKQLIHGSTWMVAMRFGIRGIGLLSTIILARLLTPADFGVVAMAMLVIGLIEVFSETGQALALIRHENPQPAHYNSAWSMTILINTALAVVILIVAPLSEAYFDEPRIVPVIQALSIRMFLGGVINIGIVNFRRDLDFAREFNFGVLQKILTFCVTMTLALLWRDYWALVVGVISGQLITVVLSYVMHPYRPRFDLSKVAELWSYSIWLLVAALGRFFETKVDGMAVAGIAPPNSVGQYTVAAELGALPVTEIIDPMTRALFPNYARVASNPEALRDAYLQVLSVIATIAAAIGPGIALVADDLVLAMLGPKWTEAGSLIVWFAIEAAIVGVCYSVFPVMNAAGESRRSAVQTWVRVAVSIPAMVWAASTGILVNFAIAKVAVSVLLIPTFFAGLRRVVSVSWGALIRAVWKPPLAALVMASVLIELRPSIAHFDAAIIRLFVSALIGAIAFSLAQVFLWLITGRPAGFERVVVDFVKAKILRIAPSTATK